MDNRSLGNGGQLNQLKCDFLGGLNGILFVIIIVRSMTCVTNYRVFAKYWNGFVWPSC